jgi:hypothetical protein
MTGPARERRATSRPRLRRGAALVAGLAAMLLSGAAAAQDVERVTGRCALTYPADWSWGRASGRGRSPGGRVVIQIREVSNGASFMAFQRAFGARLLRSDPNLAIMYQTVGATRRYYAIAPPGAVRACTAQVTSSTLERREEAGRIAFSLRRLPANDPRVSAPGR